jgi:hypothetical protein
VPDPVFTPSDAVSQPPSGGALPAELQGKSPEQVAAYYQDQIRQRDAAASAASTPVAQNPPSTSDFWFDPARATAQAVQAHAPSKEQFNQLNEVAKRGLKLTAKNAVREKYSDFARFADDIEKMVGMLPELQQCDPIFWETVYYQVKGIRADELVKEADQKARMPVEPVNPAASTPTTPVELTSTQRKIAENLGLGDEGYRKAQERMDKQEWPLTMDNRKR